MTTETRQRAEARIGTRLDGKWHLDALLGYGGSAAVFAATHRNGKRAAIKILHPHCAADEALRTRFLREGYVANKIEHPGAVSVLDDDVTEDGTVFIVMELLEGRSLEKVGKGLSPPLSLPEVVRVIDDLLDVLAKAHAIGIVHRDIKPANLFVTHAGQLKVLDFGIARLAEASAEGAAHAQANVATQTGFTMGTPAFMPPEQARGRWSEVDARSDLWAVGATMLALLLGRRPRVAETANEELLLAMTTTLPPALELVAGLPPSIARVADRALALRREDRWPNAAAMQQALRAAAAGADAGAVAAPLLAASPSTPRLIEAPLPPQHETEASRDLTTGRAVLHTSLRPAPARSSAAGVLALIVTGVLGVAGAAGLFLVRAERARPPAAATTAEHEGQGAPRSEHARSGGSESATAGRAEPPSSGEGPSPAPPPVTITELTDADAASAGPVATTSPGPAETTPVASDATLETRPAAPPRPPPVSATKPDARPARPTPRPTAAGSVDPAKFFDTRY